MFSKRTLLAVVFFFFFCWIFNRFAFLASITFRLEVPIDRRMILSLLSSKWLLFCVNGFEMVGGERDAVVVEKALEEEESDSELENF